jgi:hypothetical protein
MFSSPIVQTDLRHTLAPYPVVNSESVSEDKWPGRQAGRSPPSSFKVKNMWQYVFTPYILWRNESTVATLYFCRLFHCTGY